MIVKIGAKVVSAKTNLRINQINGKMYLSCWCDLDKRNLIGVCSFYFYGSHCGRGGLHGYWS